MSREFLLPGEGYVVDAETTARQYLVPGVGYVTETVAGVAPAQGNPWLTYRQMGA
jgi:hypothetical protein